MFSRQAEIDKTVQSYAKDEDAYFKKVREFWTVASSDLPRKLESIVRRVERRTRLGLIQGRENKALAGLIRRPIINPASKAYVVDLFHDVLFEAKKCLSKPEGRLYFVYLLERSRYAPGQSGNAERDRVLQAATNLELPIIDIHRSFMAEQGPLGLFPFRLPSHYNERGHNLVAATVLRCLRTSAEIRTEDMDLAANNSRTARPSMTTEKSIAQKRSELSLSPCQGLVEAHVQVKALKTRSSRVPLIHL